MPIKIKTPSFTTEYNEKPKQKYYYELYITLQPHNRNIDHLLQRQEELKQKGKLPYKEVKESTLYEWQRKFKWEERYYETLHHKINNIEDTAMETMIEFMERDKRVDTNHYIILEDIQQIVIKRNLNPKLQNKEEMKTTREWATIANNLMNTKKGIPSDFAETYAILKHLKKQNLTTEENNILEEVAHIMGCTEENSEEQ